MQIKIQGLAMNVTETMKTADSMLYIIESYVIKKTKLIFYFQLFNESTFQQINDFTNPQLTGSTFIHSNIKHFKSNSV